METMETIQETTLEKQRSNLDPEYEKLASEFLEFYCTIVNPRFERPPHIRKLCRALQRIESGNLKRLIVCMPPRHGKSTTISDHFPAWYLGRKPDHQIIFSTYGQNLASSFGRKVRNQLFDPSHNRIFPNCNIAYDSKAKNQFTTIEGGIYNAVGRGSSITGKGANLGILDDMLKDDREAESRSIRDGFKDWYRSTFVTRLEPDGAIILVATRW